MEHRTFNIQRSTSKLGWEGEDLGGEEENIEHSTFNVEAGMREGEFEEIDEAPDEAPDEVWGKKGGKFGMSPIADRAAL